MRKQDRARIWTFVGYPDDSLPENYREILNDEMHLCFAESPLHDADLNGDGSEKKKHIHFVVSFEGLKSFEQIKEITDRLHCPIPQQCRNVRAMVRYLIHLDNPEKHQYKKEDVHCFGGFSIEEYFEMSSYEYDRTLDEIEAFILDNGITELFQLMQLVMQMDCANEWRKVIRSRNTLYISALLSSQRNYFKDHPINS